MNKITFSATRTALFFTIFVFLLLESAIIYGETSYGENDTYLGQIVDNYFNDSYVSFMSNVQNNITLNCMELKYLGLEGSIYEDFTEYTVVDEDNDFTIIERKITWSSLRRDASSWIVYDFGENYFTDFQINFTIKFSDIEAGDGSVRDINCVMFLSDFAGTFADQLVDGDMLTVMPRQITLLDNIYIYQIKQIENGEVTVTKNGINQWGLVKHYCIFERIGTTITIRVYSDEARTNLIDTVTETGESGGYRYFSGLVGYETITGDPADHSSGYVTNVTFRSGINYPSSGYYTTIDYLNGDRALALLYDAQIVENTNMTLEFSLDNGITWLNHNNVSTYDELINGYESLNLIDLNATHIIKRVNMSSDTSNTPRMNQFRYVTIIGEVENGGDGEGGINSASIIMILFLILVGMSLIYSMRRRR